MSQQKAVLAIDYQHDFCSSDGAMSVPNAVNDVRQFGKWFERHFEQIEHITATLDTHQYIDIAHCDFWTDKDGNQPHPFTQLTKQQIDDREWKPRVPGVEDQVRQYFDKLEKPHTIWPTHCCIGTSGHQLYEPIERMFRRWSVTNPDKNYNMVLKGMFPLTEHFGVFEAEVTYEDVPETHFNQTLVSILEQYPAVYVAGEAASHCVGYSIDQLVYHHEQTKKLLSKLIVLEDCTSCIPGFEKQWEDTKTKAKELGVVFTTTEE